MFSMDLLTSSFDLPSLAMLQAFAQSNLAGKAIVVLLLIFRLITIGIYVLLLLTPAGIGSAHQSTRGTHTARP